MQVEAFIRNPGRDKISNISEEDGSITVTIVGTSGQENTIEVPEEIFMAVSKVVDKLEVGVKYGTRYIHNRVIDDIGRKSPIVEKRMPLLKKTLLEHNINPVVVDNVLAELNANKDWSLMEFEENIGRRKAKDSLYFKIYGSLKVLEERGTIQYAQKSIVRLI